MKIRYLFLVFMLPVAAMTAAAQRRTVTNSDLEHYRQQRVQAETDLRENYARLGFASPEVREHQNKESQKELLELSARLKAERLEQERREAEVQQAIWLAEAARRQAVAADAQAGYYDGGFFPGYFIGGGRRVRRFGSRPGFTQPGYFAGGHFWPTGPGTPPHPMLRVGPRR
jgi:hypothetical protein